MQEFGVGIIGCGNISTAYLKLAPLFRGITVRAVADRLPEAAAARAEEYGVRAETVAGLLAADDIDIVVNLTIPDAHYAVTLAILEAGNSTPKFPKNRWCCSLEKGTHLRRGGGGRAGSGSARAPTPSSAGGGRGGRAIKQARRG